jgi:hypothetical protein
MMTLFAAIVAELAAYEYLKLAGVGAESNGLKLRIPVWWMALGTALAFVVTLPNFPVEGGAEGHPPDGDAELEAVRLGAYAGKLEVFVGGKLSDDGGEERHHPELAEEDESEDCEDEDQGGEDAFHWA